jgi:hypothetical protein
MVVMLTCNKKDEKHKCSKIASCSKTKVLCRLDYRKEVQEHVYGNNPTHAKLRIHQEFCKPRELKYQLGKIA